MMATSPDLLTVTGLVMGISVGLLVLVFMVITVPPARLPRTRRIHRHALLSLALALAVVVDGAVVVASAGHLRAPLPAVLTGVLAAVGFAACGWFLVRLTRHRGVHRLHW